MTKAPIAIIGDEQKTDILASKGPNDVLDGKYRAKKYVKQFNTMFNPRHQMFDQPYQMAADNYASNAPVGFSPEGIDRVFLGQLAGCNLCCDECYADANTKSELVTAEEYVNAFDEYCAKFGDCGTLRISGGEPMLYQDWVCDVVRQWKKCARSYLPILWVDTNLTIQPEQHLLHTLIGAFYLGAVCGCLKPNRFTVGGERVDLGEQLDVVRSYTSAHIPLFIYWPSWDKEPSSALMIDILWKLIDIDPFLPLRFTVLKTNKYEASPNMEDASQDELDDLFYDRRDHYYQFLVHNYDPYLVGLPSHRTLPLSHRRTY